MLDTTNNEGNTISRIVEFINNNDIQNAIALLKRAETVFCTSQDAQNMFDALVEYASRTEIEGINHEVFRIFRTKLYPEYVINIEKALEVLKDPTKSDLWAELLMIHVSVRDVLTSRSLQKIITMLLPGGLQITGQQDADDILNHILELMVCLDFASRYSHLQVFSAYWQNVNSNYPGYKKDEARLDQWCHAFLPLNEIVKTGERPSVEDVVAILKDRKPVLASYMLKGCVRIANQEDAQEILDAIVTCINEFQEPNYNVLLQFFEFLLYQFWSNVRSAGDIIVDKTSLVNLLKKQEVSLATHDLLLGCRELELLFHIKKGNFKNVEQILGPDGYQIRNGTDAQKILDAIESSMDNRPAIPLDQGILERFWKNIESLDKVFSSLLFYIHHSFFAIVLELLGPDGYQIRNGTEAQKILNAIIESSMDNRQEIPLDKGILERFSKNIASLDKVLSSLLFYIYHGCFDKVLDLLNPDGYQIRNGKQAQKILDAIIEYVKNKEIADIDLRVFEAFWENLGRATNVILEIDKLVDWKNSLNGFTTEQINKIYGFNLRNDKIISNSSEDSSNGFFLYESEDPDATCNNSTDEEDNLCVIGVAN